MTSTVGSISTAIRVNTPTTPTSPISPGTPTSRASSRGTRKSWKPIMPSILGKMRSSLQHSGQTYTPPKTPELPDPHRMEREDDERLFSRLKAGYPCEDVKHILALTGKHYRDLDEHIDFVQAWVGQVREWSDTITAYLPSLPASQRSTALSLRGQVETYLTLANVLALEHAQTGGQLEVAEELLHHARLWINLGRDRTHKRFEDFERAVDEDGDSRRESSGNGNGRDGQEGKNHRRSFSRHSAHSAHSAHSHPKRGRDDVAGNLEQIATFLNELTSVEGRLPNLHTRWIHAVERLVETQDDLDVMVRAIEVAKRRIEGVLDGSAWVHPGLPNSAAQEQAPCRSVRTERARSPAAQFTSSHAADGARTQDQGLNATSPDHAYHDPVEQTRRDGGRILGAATSTTHDSAHDPFHLDDS